MKLFSYDAWSDSNIPLKSLWYSSGLRLALDVLFVLGIASLSIRELFGRFCDVLLNADGEVTLKCDCDL